MAYNKRLLFAPNGHKIDYLVIAGGGGAGADMGAGGGAGGFQSTPTGSSANPVATTTAVYRNVTFTSSSISYGVQYLIEIGAGGAGSIAGDVCPTGDNGGVSSISSSNAYFPFFVEAIGGGAGASDYGTGNSINYNARTGSSGGGATGNGSPQKAGTDGQGFYGGSYGGNYYPGSGGGAGGPGMTNAGDGGIGKRWDILGQEYWWAGGGSGAGYSQRAGNGGKGGGAGGAPRSSGGGNGDASGLAWNNGTNGQDGGLNSQTNKLGGFGGANTGGGGGGGSHYNSNNAGGNGGSGMVVLVFPKLAYSGVTTGDPIIRSGSVVGGSDLDHVALIYTQSGTYTTPLTGSLNY